MSKIALKNGDDHAEAAAKHLDDSMELFSGGHFDGCAYLSGYVIECSLKSLILVENGAPLPGKQHHRLEKLNLDWDTLRFSLAMASRTARYAPAITTGHPVYDTTIGWKETIRYRPRGHVSATVAASWLDEAKQVFGKTVAQMILNGDV